MTQYSKLLFKRVNAIHIKYSADDEIFPIYVVLFIYTFTSSVIYSLYIHTFTHMHTQTDVDTHSCALMFGK